jgi:hypothetical protein
VVEIALEIAPPSVKQGPSLGEDLVTAVLTGGKTTTRMLAQRPGSSGPVVPGLSREDENTGVDQSLIFDPDEPLNRFPVGNYGNAHQQPPEPEQKPAAGDARAGPASLPGGPGEGTEVSALGLAIVDRFEDPAAEGLALILAAAACRNARPRRPTGLLHWPAQDV